LSFLETAYLSTSAHHNTLSTMAAIQTPEGWDSTAQDYSETFHDLNFTPQYALDAICQVVGNTNALEGVKQLEAKLGRGLRVLDVACGSGALTLHMAELLRESGNGGSIVGIDFSPKMVELLNKKAEERKITNLKVLVMNGEVLYIFSL
jgi:2-polyprenyl-3-methyl-5-hydroxy-6-metoxy-1,4-benzoquinol methylase